MSEIQTQNGWTLVHLGDVTSIGSGTGFPIKYQGLTSGKFPFYKVSDMNLPRNEIWMQVHNNAIDEATRLELKAEPHPKGTVIFPKIGAAIATNKKRILTRDSCFDNNVIGIYPSSKLSSAFLYHLLLRKDLSEFANTGNPPSIRKTTLEKWIIPLPPLAEQKRIAAILDAADTLRAKRREAIAQLDSLLQSTFIDMFGDPVRNEKGWEMGRIGDCGQVITGNTPSRQHLEYYGDAIEWIKSDNINDPSFTLTKAEEGLSEQGKKVARIAPSGSILVTCIAGSSSCIGNAAIADREVAFNQQINAFVPDKGIKLWFAFGFFLMGKRLVQLASTNSMKGMVSKSAFSNITIPLPPLPLQHQFATIVESVEQQKARMQAHLAELDALFASLQARAFSGEL
jgi:type I restriction enzyme, S subunit